MLSFDEHADCSCVTEVRLDSPQDEVNISPIESDDRLIAEDQFEKFSETVSIAVEK